MTSKLPVPSRTLAGALAPRRKAAPVIALAVIAVLASGCPKDDAATPAATNESSRSGGVAGPVSGGQPGRSSGDGGVTVVETREPPSTVRTPSGKDLNVHSNKVEVVPDESGKVPALAATVVARPAAAAPTSPAASAAPTPAESGEQPTQAAAATEGGESVAAEPVAATPEEITADVAPVTVPLAELPTVELLPDTSYVIELREPDAPQTEPALETITVHTLADTPVIESVTAPEPGKLVVAIDPQDNPETTLVSVAVVDTAAGTIVAYVDVETGKPVKEEERWDALPVTASADGGAPDVGAAPGASSEANSESAAPASADAAPAVQLDDDVTVVITGLGLDPETLAVIVQAKNEEGAETLWSDPVGLLTPTLTAEEEADDLWHDENLDVEVDASLGGGSAGAFAEHVVALRDGIKRVRGQEADLTSELKALRARLKAAKAAVREGQRVARLLDRSKRATAEAIADARAALARAEAEVDALTKQLQEVKARRLALRDALKIKTAELKALLAEKRGSHGKVAAAAGPKK
jgi:hypothetical protein